MCNSTKIYCPRCLSTKVKKNGLFSKSKYQQFKCKLCSKKFSEHGQSYFVDINKRDLIKSLLLERLSLRGICRVLKISLTWLLGYIKELYNDLPDDLNFRFKWLKKEHNNKFYIKLEPFEGDELWSFVQSKANVKYVWILMHRQSRQIVAYYVGDRTRQSAQKLWDKVPDEIKQNGIFYTDDWSDRRCG
ncbi:MAG: IS1 family transposase [Cytophagales bacterium]|nr:MAG: IS1 family transposase [Cytophagales bacterium]